MFDLQEFQKFRCSVTLAVVFCTAFPLSTIAQTPFPPERSSNAVTERSAYILGPGDQVDITVFDYSEFTGAKVVLPDGTITLPLIGTVSAAGKTTERLAQELTNRLASLLVKPVVTVNLTVLRPVLVNVAGEVQRPGPIQLSSLTATNLTIGSNTIRGVPTLSKALTEAGGITQNADIRQVTLRRYGAGNSQPIIVDLWDAISSDNAPPELVLQDGDSIYVPRLTEDKAIDRRLVAKSSLSPGTVRVRVVGEVKKPGEIQVPPDSSLSSAVAIAGGPTVDARLRQVAFIRMNEQGRVVRQTVDLQNLTDTYQVQDGDVIIISKKTSSSIIDGIGRVLSPFTGLLRLFGL